MHNHGQLQHTTRLINRVQPITEVQAPVHHREATALRRHLRVITETVHLQTAAAEVTVAAADRCAAVVLTLRAVQEEVLTQEVAQVAEDHVLREAVRLLPVAGNF